MNLPYLSGVTCVVCFILSLNDNQGLRLRSVQVPATLKCGRRIVQCKQSSFPTTRRLSNHRLLRSCMDRQISTPDLLANPGCSSIALLVRLEILPTYGQQRSTLFDVVKNEKQIVRFATRMCETFCTYFVLQVHFHDGVLWDEVHESGHTWPAQGRHLHLLGAYPRPASTWR